MLNTDAEGRLVLADALAYLAEKKPQVIIDTATLTGACMVALGDDITGVIGNDETLIRDLLAAGEAVGEPMWQLPLCDGLPAADRVDRGRREEHRRPLGRRHHGGAVPGRVRRRRRRGCTWTSPARRSPTGRSDLGPRGATGVPVRTLVRYVLDRAAPDGAAWPTPELGQAPRTGPVLGVFAHPDDAEISAGGTLAKWAAAGREVHLLVLTNGDRGSSDPAQDRAELAATRRAETEAAARRPRARRASGSSTSHDGELENTQDIREAVVRRIREVRAETVLVVRPDRVVLREQLLQPLRPPHAPAPSRSTRSSPAPATRTSSPSSSTRGWRSGGARRLARLDERAQPPRGRHRVTSDAKVDALAEHASQLAEGIRFFEEFLAEDAVEAGEKIGVEHAEEFRVLDLR